MITGNRNQLTEINNQSIQISFDKLHSDWLVMTFTDVTAEPAGYDTLAYWNALLNASTLVPFQYISVVGNTISLYGGKDVVLTFAFLDSNSNIQIVKTNVCHFQSLAFNNCSTEIFLYHGIKRFIGLTPDAIANGNIVYLPKNDAYKTKCPTNNNIYINTNQEELSANYQNSLRFTIKEGNETYIGYDRSFLLGNTPSAPPANNFLIKRITTDANDNIINIRWAKNDDCRYSLAWDAGAPNKYNDPSYWT